MVDPVPSLEEAHAWRLWVWEVRPLSQLYWDPGKWLWPHSSASCAPVSFFEYTVRVGRFAQLGEQRTQSTRLRHWLHESITHDFLQ